MNWPVIASCLAGSSPYFLSYYSAMRLHGMTTHSSLDVYLTIPKRCKTKILSEVRYHFIYSTPKNVWGVTSLWITKQDKVIVSDLERTVLDALARPGLCGGLAVIIKGIWTKQNAIHWSQLVAYALRYHQRSAVKRLGFILETLGLGQDYLDQIQKTIADSNDYVSLDPTNTPSGSYYRKWRIRINLDVDEIKGSILK